MRKINQYFYRHNQFTNFGDELNEVILPKIFDIKANLVHATKSNFIGIGSILGTFYSSVTTYDDVPKIYANKQKIDVWGSGFMRKPLQGEKFVPIMNFLAVRGKYTLQDLLYMKEISTKDYENIALGDPGLLTPNIFPSSSKKTYRIGLIPHYIDLQKNKTIVTETFEKLGKLEETILIDPTWNLEKVIETITSCQIIISSSLHGLIVADSYGIPNMWVRFSDDIIGGDYKFLDYYSIYDLEKTPKTIDLREENILDYTKNIKKNYNIPYEKIEKTCKGLIEAFNKLIINI